MDYRNDLEASRLRINTLEAKLEETKASLNAREVELAECRAESDRLRQTAGAQPPKRWHHVAIGTLVFFGGSMAGFGGATMMYLSGGTQCAEIPAAAPLPTTTYKDRGSEIEGQIRVPPPPPPTPPAVVSGQTNLPEAEEKTINAVIEDARPKIRACYREETKAHPNVSGSVSVQFVIEPSGKASRTKLESSLNKEPWWSSTFEKCVIGVYRDLEFPNNTGTKVTARASYFLSALDLAF